ncbi:MAG: hypothetical protein MK142_14155, partial [Pseudomonadales bacterium]|nr:hypothetical protein [Pseudomonadales bacterium]
AMDRAAGHYSQCLLSAEASYARHGNATKLANRQARCETRFDRRTSRAINRHGADECASAELVAALADRTVSCADGVAIEASGETAASRLYVQDAAGGTLSETTLVLSDVDESTPWFTDRPYREAGQMTTAEFVALFAEEGANSFAENPPNADFTCESGGEVVNQVVTLTDPVLDEAAGTLTYTAALVPSAGEGDSFSEITCDGDAHLFIDDDLMTAYNFICDGQAYHACDVAGGTWDTGTKTCTPGVTQAGCEAGGGTWDAASSTCTSSYNCFIGGFCSHAAKLYPPADYGYINVYEDHAQATGPASGAGCNDLLGAVQWSEGAEFFNSVASMKYWGGLCTGGLNVVTTEAVLIGKHEGSCDAACQ